MALSLVDLRSGAETALFESVSRSEMAWSPTGDRLVVTRVEDDVEDLVVIDGNSGDFDVVYDPSSVMLDNTLGCSPVPGDAVFATDWHGDDILITVGGSCAEYVVSDVAIIALPTGQSRTLVHSGSENTSADFTPDGSQFVFTDGVDIRLGSTASGRSHQLGQGNFPVWGRTGLVAFVSFDATPAGRDLSAINPGNGEQRVIADLDTSVIAPAWDPTGTSLTFLADSALYLQHLGDKPQALWTDPANPATAAAPVTPRQ